MQASIDLSKTKLPGEHQASIKEFSEQLGSLLGDNLQSVILYGSGARSDFQPGKSDINLLIVLENVNLSSLKKVLDPVVLSRRYGISPLFMTLPGIESSTQVFPIKFLSMQESYQVLVGQDVLEHLEVDKQFLRLRCQQETLNLLMRLRRHYLTSAGNGLIAKATRSTGQFLATLRMILSLTENTVPSREEVIGRAGELIGLDTSVLNESLELKKSQEVLSPEEAEAFYGRFLEVVTKVARYTEQL